MNGIITRNVTLVRDWKDRVYKVFPDGNVTNLEETKVISDQGLEFFLDQLFMEQDIELYNHKHESHIVTDDADISEDEVQSDDEVSLIELKNSLYSTEFLFQANLIKKTKYSCLSPEIFAIYDNGLVIDTNGTTICVTGGKTCLLEYVKDLCYPWKYG